jgi:hypothetical protein
VDTDRCNDVYCDCAVEYRGRYTVAGSIRARLRTPQQRSLFDDLIRAAEQRKEAGVAAPWKKHIRKGLGYEPTVSVFDETHLSRRRRELLGWPLLDPLPNIRIRMLP